MLFAQVRGHLHAKIDGFACYALLNLVRIGIIQDRISHAKIGQPTIGYPLLLWHDVNNVVERVAALRTAELSSTHRPVAKLLQLSLETHGSCLFQGFMISVM